MCTGSGSTGGRGSSSSAAERARSSRGARGASQAARLELPTGSRRAQAAQLAPGLAVGRSKIDGRGCFATVPFRKWQKIAELVGERVSRIEAAQRMRDLDIGLLPVCGDNDRLVGMLTDRDITIRAVAEGQDCRTSLVRDAVTPNLIYCFEDEDITEAAELMKENQIRQPKSRTCGEPATSASSAFENKYARFSKPCF